MIADGGLFNAVLGTVKLMPSDAFAAGERYLGITVGSDDELVPRQRVVSVGYAFAAGDSEQLGGRAADAYVRSVDGVAPQNGNVDLVAGSNVTITANPGGHSVTIASSALTLPFTSSVSSASTALTVQNTGSGYGMSASSSSSYGVRAQSGGSSGYGVYGVANGTNGRGVVGSTTGANGYGVWGSSSSHYGVYGSSSTGTGVYGKQLGSRQLGFLGSATYGPMQSTPPAATSVRSATNRTGLRVARGERQRGLSRLRDLWGVRRRRWRTAAGVGWQHRRGRRRRRRRVRRARRQH